MRPAAAILESFITSNYASVRLPPLWQVIYYEAIRGHHLLFKRDDVAIFEAENEAIWSDDLLDEQIERLLLRLIASPDLQSMIKIIDAQTLTTRQSLFNVYLRVLWIARNFIKSQLN